MNRPGSVASTRTSWTSLLILLVSCLPIPVLGDSPAVISLDPGVPLHVENLGDALELLEDRVGNLDVAAVSTAPVDARFVSATLQSSNIGFSTSVWWARVTVRNPSDSSRLVYLRQDYPLIDSLDLYEPKAGGIWTVHSTGDRKPFSSRDVELRDFLFPLTLPANSDRTFYLRYASQGPVDINLSLLDPDVLAGEVSREQLAYGVYFGCVLMLLVWSGLVFLAVRDGAFLAYFAYVSTFGGAEIGCVAASAVIEEVSSAAFLEHVRKMGERFELAFAGLPFELRRFGMTMGFRFADEHGGVLAARKLIDAGVFAVFAEHDHSVTQFKPPLIVDEDEVDEIAAGVIAALA